MYQALTDEHHSSLRSAGRTGTMKRSFYKRDPRPYGTKALKKILLYYVHDDLLKIVKLLLKHSRIDLSKREMDFFEFLFLNDRWGETLTPLPEIIELLIEGLVITERDGYGWTALHILVNKYNGVDSVQTAKLLIDKGILHRCQCY